MNKPPSAPRCRVLLATSRPPVRIFFDSLGVGVVAASTIAEAADADVDVAVVDVGPESGGDAQLCCELRAHRPELPIVALVCCAHALTPWTLRALLAAGVTSILGLHDSGDDTRGALESVARGDAVLRIHLANGAGQLQDLLAAPRSRRDTRVRVLELVACGFSDQEIGRRLHLSPHTIKHHIDRLRRSVGARNRTELAAWAGRHGLYAPQ